jgi:putative salt-induced outer membrane protein
VLNARLKAQRYRGLGEKTHFVVRSVVCFIQHAAASPASASFIDLLFKVNHNMNKKILLPTAAAFMLAITSVAQAQEKPDGQFHGTASLGASFASGAVNNTTLSAAFDTARKTEADKLSFYGLAARGSTKVSGVTAVTSDLYRVGARYDRNLSKETFAFVSGELEKNGVTELDLRAAAYVGGGYHVINTPVTTFDVFAGVGYNHFDYKRGASNGATEILIGEESAHKLSESTNFKQRLAIYPSLKSEYGYRAQFDAGLSVAMSSAWNLNVTGTARYANKVFTVKKTETLLTVGVGYKF